MLQAIVFILYGKGIEMSKKTSWTWRKATKDIKLPRTVNLTDADWDDLRKAGNGSQTEAVREAINEWRKKQNNLIVTTD